MKYYFSFDVESVGLFGPPFAVGWVIVDETGKEHQQGFLGVDFEYVEPIHHLILWRSTKSDKKWVRENVLPTLPSIHPNTKSLVDLASTFWEWWVKAKREFPGIVMVTDCPFPVEAGFLRYCLLTQDLGMEDSPYPVIDVASVLLAHGFNPTGDYYRADNELPAHNPTNDARQSARLFIEVLRDSHQANFSLK